MAVTIAFVGLPCASTLSTVNLRPCPSAWVVIVWLLGGGPGLYVDFARLSFHVPIAGLLCANAACGNAAATPKSVRTNKNAVRRVMIFLLADLNFVLLARRRPPLPSIGGTSARPAGSSRLNVTAFPVRQKRPKYRL